jgi:1,3-beta-glucan synthase
MRLICYSRLYVGFSSILKFVAKIGAGMGEQILAREHYYLGSQLPLDRLLTFYYGHPGFHINNVFIIFSLQLMMFFMLGLMALKLALVNCLPRTAFDGPYAPLSPEGCADIESIVVWIKQAIFSIVAVFVVRSLAKSSLNVSCLINNRYAFATVIFRLPSFLSSFRS